MGYVFPMMMLFLWAVLAPRAGAHGGERFVRPARLSEHDTPTIETRFVNYTVLGRVFQGYAAYPKSSVGAVVPGLAIVHQWYGLGDNEMRRADEAAEHGYYAFAIDTYGIGRRATNNQEAGALAGESREDEAQLMEIAKAGVLQLRSFGGEGPAVDVIVATGYCYGGGVLLRLGREATAPVFGIATFHASFPDMSEWTNRDMKVQVHHGELDFAGDDGLFRVWAAFKNASVTTWESMYYSGANHGFSDTGNPAYDYEIATQSHNSMFSFFDTYLDIPGWRDTLLSGNADCDTTTDGGGGGPDDVVLVQTSTTTTKKKSNKNAKAAVVAVVVLAIALGLVLAACLGLLCKYSNADASGDVGGESTPRVGKKDAELVAFSAASSA